VKQPDTIKALGPLVGGMGERKQIHLRVSSDQKQRWNEYIADNAQFSSLTDLIRTSVEREIGGVSSSNGGEVNSEQLDLIEERTEKINSRLNSMEAALGDAVEAMHTSGVEIDEDTTTVWSHVPRGIEAAKTPKDIAKAVTGVEPPERQVQKYEIVLDQLSENTGIVERTYHVVENGTEYQDETPHYYKTDE